MRTCLETKRLIVRSFEPGDADPWVAMVNDPEVTRFLPPVATATRETFERILEERRTQEDDIGYSMWAVVDRTTVSFVGQCGIRPVDEGAGPEVELAYHFMRTAWNKGFATESARAVLGHGLGSVGLARIVALVMPNNVGSVHVLEKSGMRQVGVVEYFGLSGLAKYEAEQSWWRPPPQAGST